MQHREDREAMMKFLGKVIRTKSEPSTVDYNYGFLVC